MPDARTESEPRRVLLYDGTCGFCNWSVQFVLARDKSGTILFAPLQSAYGKAVIHRHPSLEGIDSLILVENAGQENEKVSMRSSGALRVASYLGWPWKALGVFAIIPTRVRDWIYDSFARNRYRWFGRHDVCVLPPPEVRSRFIDTA